MEAGVAHDDQSGIVASEDGWGDSAVEQRISVGPVPGTESVGVDDEGVVECEPTEAIER